MRTRNANEAITSWMHGREVPGVEINSSAVGVAEMPAARRIWQPHEIEFSIAGSGAQRVAVNYVANNWSGYRFVPPGTDFYYSQVFSWEGCEELYVQVVGGAATAGLKTAVDLLSGMIGGSDATLHMQEITSTSGDENQVTAIANAASYLLTGSKMATTNNVLKRQVTYQYWQLRVKPATADPRPLTFWVMGR